MAPKAEGTVTADIAPLRRIDHGGVPAYETLTDFLTVFPATPFPPEYTIA